MRERTDESLALQSGPIDEKEIEKNNDSKSQECCVNIPISFFSAAMRLFKVNRLSSVRPRSQANIPSIFFFFKHYLSNASHDRDSQIMRLSSLGGQSA